MRGPIQSLSHSLPRPIGPEGWRQVGEKRFVERGEQRRTVSPRDVVRGDELGDNLPVCLDRGALRARHANDRADTGRASFSIATVDDLFGVDLAVAISQEDCEQVTTATGDRVLLSERLIAAILKGNTQNSYLAKQD